LVRSIAGKGENKEFRLKPFIVKKFGLGRDLFFVCHNFCEADLYIFYHAE